MCGNTYRYWSGPQEVKVCVFPKQVTLRMGGVKLLPPHDEMACEVTSCTQRNSLLKTRNSKCITSSPEITTIIQMTKT